MGKNEKHDWECTHPGYYDDGYTCKKCGEYCCLSADNPEKKLPETGCIVLDTGD
jgi:hypothetical protein